MIVPSMTVQEIHNELFEDAKNLGNKVDYCHKDFMRAVLKTNRYPYKKSYECKTKEKKNLFIVTLTAMKRSSRREPNIGIFGIYTRPEGNYAVALTLDMKITSIYPPHFFKRYRERIVKDDSMSNIDIIKHHFENGRGFIGAVVDEHFESVYHCFENDNKDDKVDFVAASTEGYCFGEKQGKINIFKTIVSEEMLFDNQKPLFDKLRNALNEKCKEYYGNQG